MTVEELIEELQRMPNQKVIVKVELSSKSGNYIRECDGARFDGPSVTIKSKGGYW